MGTRADVVRIALGELGYHTQGQGYDERGKYSQYFLGPSAGALGEGGNGPNNVPFVAYCDIFVSWCFAQAGIPLPNMGGMISQGNQYCPSSYAYAAAHGALRSVSSDAQPGDQVIFNWNGDSQPLGGESHTEIVVKWENDYLTTCGANSGPAGGVNQHAWYCPAGVGNNLIQGVIDTSKLVTFGAIAPPVTPKPPVKPPTTSKDWTDTMSRDELKAAIREVLNEGTGQGQVSWSKTSYSDHHNIEQLINIGEAVAGHLGVELSPKPKKATA